MFSEVSSMLVVFGSLNADLIFQMPALPVAGQTLLCDALRIESGGKGANQALAAYRDGASVSMVGAVGQDEMADVALRGLRAGGVDVTRVLACAQTTGCAAIQTDREGRNQISVAAGANLAARAVQVDDALLAQASLLLLQMEVDVAQVCALVERAHGLGVRSVLNLAPALDIPRQTLERLWCLVVNEDEAQSLAERLGCGDSAAQLSQELGIGVIRTLGAQGVEACTDEGEWRVAAEPIDALDSTAAGDCFVGVLASALARGEPFAAALERGCRLAGLHAAGQPR